MSDPRAQPTVDRLHRRGHSSAMFDLRPIGYIVGLMIAALGGLMLIPAAVDALNGEAEARAFLTSGVISLLVGAMLALATRNSLGRSLSVRQAFLLTIAIWIALPLFGCLPFMLGAPQARFVDAYFEAVSGITTTGASVLVGVEAMPPGLNLWRGMLQWLGGLGIAFIAMIFLPVMRVGGMQFFRTEGFDTLGKVMPRATDIAVSLFWVYAGLTVAAWLTYSALGMTPLDAVVHAMASISTAISIINRLSAVDRAGGLWAKTAPYASLNAGKSSRSRSQTVVFTTSSKPVYT